MGILVRNGSLWDPSEARRVIERAQAKGFEFFGFELGNEQNGRGAEREAADFAVLRDLLVQMYPDASTRPKIVGPDGLGFHDGSFHDGPEKKKLNYLHDFVQECQRLDVPLHAATHHEYVEVSEYSKAPPPASRLNKTGVIAKGVNASISPFGVQIWAGEIGPHNGKSPGCDHTSMRWANFADSFWYLDAMGTKAANGYSVFCRQDFVGIDYGMVDCATYDPLPDYYAGILWSQLMGTAVVATNSDDANTVRAYAHCSAKASGDLAVLLLNLATSPINVTVKFAGQIRTEYILTGPDGTDGQAVALNGQRLVLSEEGKVPSLVGVKRDASTPVMMPAASIAFLEYHNAGCGESVGNAITVV